MIERFLISLLILLGSLELGGCRPSPKAASPGTAGAAGVGPLGGLDGAMEMPEVVPGALDSLPRFRVDRANEITLSGPLVAAEAVLLRKGAIDIYTRQGQVSFSPAGQRGASDGGGGVAALGADGFYNPDGTFVYALVSGQALVWFGWEASGSGLEGIRSGTGLGIGRDHSLCDGCIYVSDGDAQSLKEYGGAGTVMRELALPGTDPEGVAVAPGSGKVYVADAKGRRLFRVDSRLDKIEAVALLPTGAGGNVPTGLEFDDAGQLYVCFRDKNVLLVLALPDGA